MYKYRYNQWTHLIRLFSKIKRVQKVPIPWYLLQNVLVLLPVPKIYFLLYRGCEEIFGDLKLLEDP
jgi:hypothetical protein